MSVYNLYFCDAGRRAEFGLILNCIQYFMRKVFKWGSSSSKCPNFGQELARAANALGRLRRLA